MWFVYGLRCGKSIFWKHKMNTWQTMVQSILKKCRQQACGLRTWKKLFTQWAQFPLYLRKKLRNFNLWWMVSKLLADGTVHVCSPIHTYVHLVCEWFADGLVCKYVPALPVFIYKMLYSKNGEIFIETLNGVLFSFECN